MLVNRRAGLVVGNHAQDGIAGGLDVQLFGEGVGEIHDAAALRHGAHSGSAVIHIGADHIVDAFLGHFFHAGNGALGVFLVVKRHDLHVIGGAADFHAAGFVDPVGACLHGALVGDAPACGRAGSHADKTDFQNRVGRECCAAKRQAEHGAHHARDQKIAFFHVVAPRGRMEDKVDGDATKTG